MPSQSTHSSDVLPAENFTRNDSVVVPTDRVLEPLLWKIDNRSYLYGTMHSSDLAVLTLPLPVYEALDASEEIYTETGAGLGENYDSFILPENERLRDVLPASVYERLDNYLVSQGISITRFSHLRIWTMAVFLDFLPEMSSDRVTLDQYLMNKVYSKKLYVGALERPGEAELLFTNLSTKLQIEFLNNTLDRLEQETDSSHSNNLTAAYMRGDADALEFYVYENSTPQDENFRIIFVDERNKRMARRIGIHLKNHPEKSFFFAAGAAHMIGEHGIVQLLRNEGHTVERVSFQNSRECPSYANLEYGKCYVPYEEVHGDISDLSEKELGFGERRFGEWRNGECGDYPTDNQQPFTTTLCFEGEVYNAVKSPDDVYEYTMSVSVTKKGKFGENGEVIVYKDDVSMPSSASDADRGFLLARGKVDVNNLSHGYYSVEWIITDLVSGKDLWRTESFLIE